MAGLRLLRPGSGLVQLSSVDICYQLASIGSVLLTDSGFNRPQPIVIGQVTVSGTNPILAFRAANGAPVTVRSVSASGSSVTYEFQAQSATAVGVVYWCFDVATNAGAQITGPRMRTWTEQGVKTFDSAAFAMRLASTGSGANVAVIQSMYANKWTFENMGNTGDGFWVVKSTRFQTAARFNSNGTIDTGLLQYETQTVRTNPANGMPNDEEWGNSSHTFIDVAGLPSATMPSQNGLGVGLSASLREVTVSSATATSTISPSVTATPSGGVAPYQFEWYRRQGGGGVGAYGATNEASFRTQTANQPPNSTYEETWGCRVTDATGKVGYSPDVVFRHIVQGIDLTPDAISYANVSNTTVESIGFAGVPSKQVNGISQQITLRAERFNYSGNFDRAYLWVYKGPSDVGPWTLVQTLDARGTATRYADFAMSNGEWFYFYAQAETDSGIKSGNFDVTIWNESTGHTFLAAANLAVVVDSDNNFNIPDYTPGAINVPNLTISTNSNTGTSANSFQQVNGINRQITLRFSRDQLTGNLSTSALRIGVGPTSSGPWTFYAISTSTGSLDFTFNNGDWFYTWGEASTTSGIKTGSWRNTITNVTTGAQIDTFTVTATVDADNNYNVSDPNLNAIDWSNIFFNTTANSYFTTNAYRSMAGINVNISLSIQVANFFVSGGAITNSVWAMQSSTRGDLFTANLGNGSRTATVQPNEQIRFGINIATTGGRREFGFDVGVYNNTTGAFIDHFYVSGYVGA